MDKIKKHSNKILVGKLPSKANKYDIVKYFSEFGDIKNTFFVLDKFTGKSKGFCFIEFYFHASVVKTLRNNRHEFMGKKIFVSSTVA